MRFDDPELLSSLEERDDDTLDRVPFGIIAMDQDLRVTFYNATEAEDAGLSKERVVGRDFFHEVAPCMNNFLVAQRYLDEPRIDAVIDYVLTLKMRPTKVRLRLLKTPGARRSYLLVNRT